MSAPPAPRGCFFAIPETHFTYLDDNHGGFCLLCGAEAYGIEPDARRYKCEHCDGHFVYGAQELLIMGRIEFLDPAGIEAWEQLTDTQREHGYQQAAFKRQAK